MPTESLAPAALLVLATFTEKPRHPYEVFTVLRDRYDDRHVALSPGTLYHRVNKLADAGLLAEVATEVEGNRPERTIYDITDSGRERLRAGLRTHLVRLGDEREFRVALSEAAHLSEGEVAELLRERRRRLRERLDEIGAGREGADARHVPRGYILDIELTVAQLDAEWRVIDGIVADLESGRLTWPEPGSFTAPQRAPGRKPASERTRGSSTASRRGGASARGSSTGPQGGGRARGNSAAPERGGASARSSTGPQGGGRARGNSAAPERTPGSTR